MSRLRIDRLATLHLVRPLRRILTLGPQFRIPILMYHSISERIERDVHPYFALETSAQVFESHMKFLHENDYQTISTEEAVAHLNSRCTRTGKFVAITFDDGYRNFYTSAFPVLSKYGFQATVYLPTAHVSRSAQPKDGRDCMTWTEVRELRRSGIHFGSHTVSHPWLRFISLPNLIYELKTSKDTIEHELGEPIKSFSYPYAFPENDSLFVSTLRGLLEYCQYDNGVSTVIGSSDSSQDRYFLRRLPANSWDDLELFRAKLEGSYDWLRAAQYLHKKIERKRRVPTMQSVLREIARS